MSEPHEPVSEPQPGLRLALHQPDRPHNFGAPCACAPVSAWGSMWSSLAAFRSTTAGFGQLHSTMAGMPGWVRHMDFAAFDAARLAERRRLVLLSTAGEHFYHHRCSSRTTS